MARPFPWIEALFVVAVGILVAQLFPGIVTGVTTLCDVRTWSWRNYAVASAVALALLLVAKASANR